MSCTYCSLPLGHDTSTQPFVCSSLVLEVYGTVSIHRYVVELRAGLTEVAKVLARLLDTLGKSLLALANPDTRIVVLLVWLVVA